VKQRLGSLIPKTLASSSLVRLQGPFKGSQTSEVIATDSKETSSKMVERLTLALARIKPMNIFLKAKV